MSLLIEGDDSPFMIIFAPYAAVMSRIKHRTCTLGEDEKADPLSLVPLLCRVYLDMLDWYHALSLSLLTFLSLSFDFAGASTITSEGFFRGVTSILTSPDSPLISYYPRAEEVPSHDWSSWYAAHFLAGCGDT